MLAFADQLFRLEKTEFSACIGLGEGGWGVSWTLEFLGSAREIDGLDWAPRVSSHWWQPDLPSLSRLPGWQCSLVHGKGDEPDFLVYVVDHEPLEAARLEFGEWRGDNIDFVLTGKCHVGLDDRYDRDVPVRISLPLRFDGVRVDETSVDKAEEKLARFFERGMFGPPVVRDEGGYLFRLCAVPRAG